MRQEELLKKQSKTFLIKAISIFAALFLFQAGFSQIDPDSTNFIVPIDYELKLAGSFAELRTNHFHSGIDIKSKDGTGGEDILAAESGFISRIKIQSGGYGRAIYMDHPNGYTTVYAHMEKFDPSLDQYVEDIQISVEQFEVDIYLPPGKFTFEQGEVIGTLGNTGRSYAPHLHFEIRETASEQPMLPSLFNIKVDDDIPPVIKEVYVYELDEYGNPYNKFKVGLLGEKGNYRIAKNTVQVNSQRIGIGVNTYDRANGVWNKNGVYDLSIQQADSTIFYSSFDKISFSESKAINAIIDYKHFEKNRSRIMKLFNTECNPLSNYSNSGWLDLSINKEESFEVSVGDAASNKSSFKITFICKEVKKKSKGTGFKIQCGTVDTIQLASKAKVIFFENSLYNDQNISITEEGYGIDYNIQIENENTPAHRAFKLIIPNITDPAISIVKLEDGGLTNFGGHIEGENFVAYLDEFGNYFMSTDDIAPSISRVGTVTKNGHKEYSFKITDNLDYDSSLGDYEIHVSANNKWIPFNYDLKNDLLIINQKFIPSENKILSIKVTDHSGNLTEYKLEL